MAPIRRVQMQGPRPTPLNVNRSCSTSSEMIKKPVPKNRRRSPVIVYLRSPTIIHVKPQDFMRLVQSLTGNKSSMVPSFCSSSSSCVTAVDGAMSERARSEHAW